MPKFTCLLPGKEIASPAEDFRSAARVEQYRIGSAAVYVPSGFSWEYVPLSEIKSASESHRNITAGHCVTVTERKPAVELVTEADNFTLNLDKSESVQKILSLLPPQA